MNTTSELHERASSGNADTGLDVVTGAFSYCGSAIARELLGVRALGAHPDRPSAARDPRTR